jgi:hypothetical protein
MANYSFGTVVSNIKKLADEGRPLIAAIEKHITTDLVSHLKVEPDNNKSPYKLQVSLHGVRLLFRVELFMEKSVGEGNVCAYILLSDLSGKLTEDSQVAKHKFPNYSMAGCIIEDERKKFAREILVMVSDALANAVLKLQ